MIPFDFIRAGSIEEALDFLAEQGPRTRVIAGGTDLVVELRSLRPGDPVSPRFILDISGIGGLKGIREEGEGIILGPLATHAEIAGSEILRARAGPLPCASAAVGAAQHRSVGTVGGNVINASPAADTVPALVALDAEAVFLSRAGERRLLLKEIFVKPYSTKIRPDELLARIRFRKLPASARSSFLKLGRRNALAVARMNVAVVLFLEGGMVAEARIAPGSATPTPDRIGPAEEVLIGKAPTEELIVRAGERVGEEMVRRTGARWSTPYKRPAIEALVARALRMALEGGSEQGQQGHQGQQGLNKPPGGSAPPARFEAHRP